MQAPVSNRAYRPYGSQLGTCRACNVSVTKGRFELPSPYGHDVLSVARLPVAPLGHVQQPVRESNRAPLRSSGRASVRGWHPKPIDERAMLSVRRAGVEPANPQGMAGLRPVGLTNAQSSRIVQVAQAGVEPAVTKVSGTAAQRWSSPLCRFAYRAIFQATSMGFEPTISCVTGRRALQAAPRGH